MTVSCGCKCMARFGRSPCSGSLAVSMPDAEHAAPQQLAARRCRSLRSVRVQRLTEPVDRNDADRYFGRRFWVQNSRADESVAMTNRVQPVWYTRVVHRNHASEDPVRIERRLVAVERGLPEIELLALPEVVHHLE